MAEQIKFGDRLFLAGEKVILDNGGTSPRLEARNGELVIGFNIDDVQAKNHHVLIKGDLTVEGTTTTVNSEKIRFEDPVIEIGAEFDADNNPIMLDHPEVGFKFYLNSSDDVAFKFKRTGAGWSDAPWIDYNFDDYASWKLLPITDGDGTDRLILTNLASENFYSVNVDINGGEIDGTGIGLNSSAESVFSTMTTDDADINGGEIDGTEIGSSVSSTGVFSTLTSDLVDLNGGSINNTIIGFEVAASAVFTDVIADSISTDRLVANIANLGDFTFNQNVMSVVSEQMEIRSPGGISFYPDSDNSLPVTQGGEKIVWLRDGAKLVFEGTIPDDYEVKLQATDITEDRDIILPDESGTLALQEWVRRELNYVQFQNIISDGQTSDFVMNFTVEEDWQALVYIDGVLQEPSSSYTITNGDQLSFTTVIPNGSRINLIRLANNSHTSTVVSADDSQKLNSQPGSYYLDYNNFYNVPTNVTSLSNDAAYISIYDGYATEQYVNTYVGTQVSNLVNSAPATLDTLNELAAALGDDPHFSTSVTNLIGTKAATTYVDSEISNAISTASSDATTKANNAKTDAIATANAYTDNAIANIPTPSGGGYPNFVSSQNLSHGSAYGGTTVSATIPNGATIAYIPWTTVNSARNSGPFNVIVNGTSYFVDDMATGGDSGSTSGLLEIGLTTGTIIRGGAVIAMLGTPVTSLQLYSQHNDSDRGSASVSATVYYDA